MGSDPMNAYIHNPINWHCVWSEDLSPRLVYRFPTAWIVKNGWKLLFLWPLHPWKRPKIITKVPPFDSRYCRKVLLVQGSVWRSEFNPRNSDLFKRVWVNTVKSRCKYTLNLFIYIIRVLNILLQLPDRIHVIVVFPYSLILELFPRLKLFC